METINLRPLPALNDNYTPARPWTCVSHEAHACSGPVVGAIYAIPVCANGEVAERAAVAAHQARMDALFADPKFAAAIAAEAAMERRIEGGQR